MKLTKEQKFYAQLVEQVRGNDEFKKEFMKDPVAAIKKYTGRNIILSE